jgi:hypothetical protein
LQRRLGNRSDKDIRRIVRERLPILGKTDTNRQAFAADLAGVLKVQPIAVTARASEVDALFPSSFAEKNFN